MSKRAYKPGEPQPEYPIEHLVHIMLTERRADVEAVIRETVLFSLSLMAKDNTAKEATSDVVKVSR